MNNNATKAYQINLSRIEEGFLYSEIFCHASSRNQAKSLLLKKVRYDGMQLSRKDEDITYTNIPVVRYPDADLIEFEGEYITKNEIDRIIRKRERIQYLEGILNNESVSHCYIRKHGSYYRPNACGYTAVKSIAGIYTKEDAVRHGKSCDDLQIIPINNEEHNQMIQEEIKNLQSKII